MKDVNPKNSFKSKPIMLKGNIFLSMCVNWKGLTYPPSPKKNTSAHLRYIYINMHQSYMQQ